MVRSFRSLHYLLAFGLGASGCTLKLNNPGLFENDGGGSSAVTRFSSNFVWVGGGGNAFWATDANWSGGTAPGGSDVAVFDGTCQSNCNPTIAGGGATVGGITMTSAYSGTINAGTGAVTINGSISIGGGTFNATTGLLTIRNDFTISGTGHFAHNNGSTQIGTCTSTEGMSTVISGGKNFYNLRLCKDNENVLFDDEGKAQGTLNIDITNGGWVMTTFPAELIAFADANVTTCGKVFQLTMKGTAAQTLTGNTNCAIDELAIIKTGGSLTLAGTIKVQETWNHMSGTIASGTSTVRIGNYNGGDISCTIYGTAVFDNLVLEKANGYDVVIDATASVRKDLTISNCNAGCVVSGGTMSVSENFSVTSNGGGTTAITMVGTSLTANISQTGGTMPGGTFTINRDVSAELNLLTDIVLNAAGQDLVLQETHFNLNGHALTVNDRIDHTGGRLVMTGAETIVKGSYNPSSNGWAYIVGTTSVIPIGYSLSNLRIFGSLLLSAPLTVANTLLLNTGGALDANGQQINLGDQLSCDSNFTASGNTIVLTGNGNHHLSCAASFYNLTFNPTAAATLLFAEGLTVTVTNNLNLQGQAGQLLTLRSYTNGAQFGINATGSRTLAYLNVKDSNNTSGNLMHAGATSTDSGNNVGWDFIAVSPVNLEVPIEMLLGYGMHSFTAATTHAQSAVSLNTTDYDGTVSYYFEILATNADSSAKTVNLRDGLGSDVAAISVPSGTLNVTRFRSTAFTPTSGAQTYRLRTSATTSNGQVELFASRILVRQVGATRTKIFIPMSGSPEADGYLALSDGGDYLCAATGTAYTDSCPAIAFKKIAANWGGLAASNPWTFEAVLGADPAAAAYAQIYDLSGNAIPGTEVSLPAGSGYGIASVSFADNAANFTNGATVKPRLKSANANQIKLFKAGLWVKLDGITKGESHYRIHSGCVGCNRFASVYQRMLLDTSVFSNPAIFTEGMGSSATHPGFLVDEGTLDSGFGLGTDVLETEVTFTGSPYEVVRSGGYSSIVSGRRYTGSARGTGGYVGWVNLVVTFNP